MNTRDVKTVGLALDVVEASCGLTDFSLSEKAKDEAMQAYADSLMAMTANLLKTIQVKT